MHEKLTDKFEVGTSIAVNIKTGKTMKIGTACSMSKEGNKSTPLFTNLAGSKQLCTYTKHNVEIRALEFHTATYPQMVCSDNTIANLLYTHHW